MKKIYLLGLSFSLLIFSPASFSKECTVQQYLQQRPDVVQNGMDAITHYTRHGISEGMCRPTGATGGPESRTCSVEAYLKQRPDVVKAGMDAITHYTRYGISEGMCNPTGTDTTSPSNADGNMLISSKDPNNPVRLKTCSHDAGAVCSITWKGLEFIDDHDHGRQLQSATTFNRLGEGYNPTEAGSSYLHDGFNPSPSTSNLISAEFNASSLHTKTQMAFWNPVNGVKRSNHVLDKWVTLGAFNSEHIIEYKTQFTIPSGENLQLGQIEILTGYMPKGFSRFSTFNPATGQLASITDGPGEQKLPIILSTPNGSHAMGIYSPMQNMTYGRWRFPNDKVVKWNQVTRFQNPAGVHNFISYVVIGTLKDAQNAIKQLYNQNR